MVLCVAGTLLLSRYFCWCRCIDVPCATETHFTVNQYSFCVFRFCPFHSFILFAVSALSTAFVVFPANLRMLVLSAHFHISINWWFARFVCRTLFWTTVQWQRNKEREIFLFSIRILFPFCLWWTHNLFSFLRPRNDQISIVICLLSK